MPKLTALMGMIKYLPTVLEVAKSVRGGGPATAVADDRRVDKVQEQVGDLRKQLNGRMDDLHEQLSSMRQMQREIRAAVDLMRVLMWTSFGLGAVALALAIIALIVR